MNIIEIFKEVQRRRRKLRSLYSWEKHKLSDWYHTYISTRTHEYETSLGYKLRTRGYIANKLMVASNFETTEMSILRSLIEDGDIFIDIGANIGYYTCLACSLGKKVLAFEPQQHNLTCLLDNILINNWAQLAEVYSVGLSDKPDILTLYGASGPSASLLDGWAGYSNKYRQLIPVNNLDNILTGRYLDNKIVIKIDVEGAEYNVLKGAINTLGRENKPTWFLEICLDQFHPDSFNSHFEDTFALFFKNGYGAYIADETRTAVTFQDVRDWVQNRSTGSTAFNYYFVPLHK